MRKQLFKDRKKKFCSKLVTCRFKICHRRSSKLVWWKPFGLYAKPYRLHGDKLTPDVTINTPCPWSHMVVASSCCEVVYLLQEQWRRRWEMIGRWGNTALAWVEHAVAKYIDLLDWSIRRPDQIRTENFWQHLKTAFYIQSNLTELQKNRQNISSLNLESW